MRSSGELAVYPALGAQLEPVETLDPEVAARVAKAALDANPKAEAILLLIGEVGAETYEPISRALTAKGVEAGFAVSSAE